MMTADEHRYLQEMVERMYEFLATAKNLSKPRIVDAGNDEDSVEVRELKANLERILPLVNTGAAVHAMQNARDLRDMIVERLEAEGMAWCEVDPSADNSASPPTF